MIAILLATYNGARYLQEQLDSLFSQSYQDFTLFVRDDMSSDSTMDILKKYSNLHANMVILDNGGEQLGATSSFMLMLQSIDAEFYMFCDQDDVWYSDKIEKSISQMRSMDTQKPNLVFTDLEIVDEHLKRIHISMWSQSKINPNNVKNFYSYISSATITGCTMLINRKVKDIIYPYPNHKLIYHDWWIGLKVLENKGGIAWLNEPTIKYRQHSSNVLGMPEFNFWKRLLQFSTAMKEYKEIGNTIKQYGVRFNSFKRLGYKIKGTIRKIIQ